MEIPWEVQRILYWLRAQWCMAILRHECTTRFRKRIVAILQAHDVPDNFTLEWFLRTSVVYMKVSLFHRYFYIGSTTLDIFQREQSRLRKFRQLEKNQLAYYEPALKFWHRTNTFWQYVGIPLLHVKTDVLAVETALQKQLSPTLNWPHILPLLLQRQM